MMQDRCNGFSGRRYTISTQVKACQRLPLPPWSLFTQPADYLAPAFRVNECGVGWAKEGNAIGGVKKDLIRAVSPWKKMAAEIAPVKRVCSTFDARRFKDGLAS
jgi:hypothetical protein